MKTAPDRNFDAAQLPDHAYGTRTVLGWGTWGFIAVEGAIFAVLIATYLYGMGRADEWPPPRVEPPQLLFGILATALVFATVIPNLAYQRAAHAQRLDATRRCLALMLVLEIALLVVRGFEFAALQVRWDDHFYGSILWTLLGFHTIHLFSDVVETAVLLALSRRRGVRPHRFADMADNALYWHFAVVVWLPLAVLIYIVPRWN